MNLIVNSITLVDLSNKEARRITFSNNKNLLTSAKNHLGKSVIMKAIYYTLGAEVYFPTPIKSINLLTYVNFTLDHQEYLLSRINRTFVLYRGSIFLKKYTSIDDLREDITKLFKLEINLVGKDEDGSIIPCPPAFYYLPYYIDQENGWASHSTSFDRITQFDLPQRKNSYFFHLGALDNNYVKISKGQKANERKIEFLKKENEKLKTVVETLNMGLDETQMAFDIDALEHAITQRKKGIAAILKSVEKSRRELIEAEDEKSTLSHDKEVLAKYIKKNNINTASNEEMETLECPRCGMIFEKSKAYKLEKTYLLESLNDDYLSISKEIQSLEKRIEKLNRIFEENQNSLKSFEKSLAGEQNAYDTYVKAKTTKQILSEYNKKIGENSIEINNLDENNKIIRKKLSSYMERRALANNVYNSYLGKLFIELDIPKGQVEDNSEPGSPLTASGAYGPRCKVSQVLAFAQAKYELSPDIINFPIAIDSPNSLEQDHEHLDSVIKTLLTWDKTDNQIIVASIGGRETAATIPDINIITLTNPQNHLLSKEVYEECEEEIREIFMMY